jgi:hypothetical protein
MRYRRGHDASSFSLLCLPLYQDIKMGLILYMLSCLVSTKLACPPFLPSKHYWHRSSEKQCGIDSLHLFNNLLRSLDIHYSTTPLPSLYIHPFIYTRHHSQRHCRRQVLSYPHFTLTLTQSFLRLTNWYIPSPLLRRTLTAFSRILIPPFNGIKVQWMGAV